MPVYLINSYDILDMEAFKSYPPKVAIILKKYGASVLASDLEAKAFEGKARTINAIIEFPSAEAATNCYNDPEYAEIKNIRLNSTTNYTMILVNAYGH